MSSTPRAAGSEVALSFVVPLFNSAETIAAVVGDIEALSVQGGHEIILVNDGSIDATSAVCRELVRQSRIPITLVEHALNYPASPKALT